MRYYKHSLVCVFPGKLVKEIYSFYVCPPCIFSCDCARGLGVEVEFDGALWIPWV